MDFKESLRVAYYSATGKLIGDIPVKENREVARRAATEGIVLLKNEGVLPLVPGNIALFGCGSEDTAFCGTGSGYAFSPKNISERIKSKQRTAFTSNEMSVNSDRIKTAPDK